MAVITIGLKHGHFTLNFDDKFSNLTTPKESSNVYTFVLAFS